MARRRKSGVMILLLACLYAGVTFSAQQPDSCDILLANHRIHPSEGTSIISKGSKNRVKGALGHADTGEQLPFLVQFCGPIRTAQRLAIEQAGAQIQGYVPHNTYLIRAQTASLAGISRVEGVRWIGEYLPEHKLQHQLMDSVSATRSTSGSLAHKNGPETPQNVVVTVMPASDTPEAICAARAMGGTIGRWSNKGRKGVFAAALTPTQVANLTDLPCVEWIEPDLIPSFDINKATAASKMNVEVMWDDTGLSGTNQIIGHADTGIDLGSMTNMHPDMAGRIEKAFSIGRACRVEHQDSGVIYGVGITGTERWVAVRLDAASARINMSSVEFFLWCNTGGDAGGSISAALFSDSSGTPGSRVSDWATREAGEVLVSCGDWVSFVFTNTAVIHAETDYWLVIDASSVSGVTAYAAYTSKPQYGANTWNEGGIWLSTRRRYYHRILANDGPWDDPYGHGTHTAGSLIGNGSCSTGTYRGVAYEAKLIHQSLIDSNGTLSELPADIGDLFQQAYDAGARIHSDSWSAGISCVSHGTYPTISRQVDEFMWNHPDMLIVFSAGNEARDLESPLGIVDEGSIKPPGTAKNILTVGASENTHGGGGCTYGDVWPGAFPAYPINQDGICDAEAGMAGFSGRGPCNDGRTKPDVVAPGTYVASCRSRNENASYCWGIANNQQYAYGTGTSMACPLAAGAAALVRQYYMDFRNMTNPVPSAALIKATLLNGAVSLTPGQYGTTDTREVPDVPRPNHVEGWGQLNLGESLVPTNSRRMAHFDRDTLATGEFVDYFVDVLQTGRLCVTMAYTDYPAEVASAAQLVNDLDIVLISPNGTEYYPNSSSGPDRTNNVETIELAAENTMTGSYQIRVSGFSVPQGPQPFALVITGGEIVPRASLADLSRSVSNNMLELSWASRVGYDYTLQRRADLKAKWLDVPTYADMPGTGARLSCTNIPLAGPMSFYQVTIEPHD